MDINEKIFLAAILFICIGIPVIHLFIVFRKAFRKSGTKLDMRLIEFILIVLYIAWFVMILMVTSYPAPGFAAPGYAIVFCLTLLSLIYYVYSLIAPAKEDGAPDDDLNYPDVPKGVLTRTGARVWLCKDFKTGRELSAHPRKIFTVVLPFFCLFIFNSYFFRGIFFYLFYVLYIGMILGFCIGVAYLMEKYNWHLQSAFIRLDGKLYYMRLGYINVNRGDVAVEFEGVKSALVRSTRRDPERYSYLLSLLLGEYESHADVVKFIRLNDPVIESKDALNTVISYSSGEGEGDRYLLKVRNGYDWPNIIV